MRAARTHFTFHGQCCGKCENRRTRKGQEVEEETELKEPPKTGNSGCLARDGIKKRRKGQKHGCEGGMGRKTGECVSGIKRRGGETNLNVKVVCNTEAVKAAKDADPIPMAGRNPSVLCSKPLRYLR